MSSDNPKLGDVDMATLMAELRRQNEEMLEKHKEELERQFAQQMSSALAELKPPRQQQQQQQHSSAAGAYMARHRSVHPDDLDAQTNRFRDDAMNVETAPKYRVSDGQRQVTLRASMEGRGTSEPYAVSATGGGAAGASSSSSSSGGGGGGGGRNGGRVSGGGGKKRTGKQAASSGPVDPRFAKYAEPVWDVGKGKKRGGRRRGEEDDVDAEEMEGLDTAIVDYYGETVNTRALLKKETPKPKADGPKKAAYSELGGTTGYLLRKSEWMVSDADKTTKRKKKKKVRAMKQAANASSSLPPIAVGGGGEEEEDGDYYDDDEEEDGGEYGYNEDHEAGGSFAVDGEGGGGAGGLVPAAWSGGGAGSDGGSEKGLFPPIAEDGRGGDAGAGEAQSLMERPGTSTSRGGGRAGVSAGAGARPGTSGSRGGTGGVLGGSLSEYSMDASLSSHMTGVDFPLSPAPAPNPTPAVQVQTTHDVVDLPTQAVDPNASLHPDLHGRRVTDYLTVTTNKGKGKGNDSMKMSKAAQEEKDDAYGNGGEHGSGNGNDSMYADDSGVGNDASAADSVAAAAAAAQEAVDANNAFDPVGWENNIARHILSMYASTKYGEDEYNSKVILDYADRSKSGSVAELKEELRQDPLDIPLLERTQGWDDDQYEGETVEEEECHHLEHMVASATTSGGTVHHEKAALHDTAIGVPTKMPSPERMKESGIMTYEEAAPPPPNTHFGRSSYGDELKQDIRARAAGQPRRKKKSIYDKDGAANKFRTQTKCITKDFREVVIRGLPKAYCIWFSSTSDVYSDWTLLPGGEKLQAQLAVMLERKRYFEYLGIVETLLDSQWAAALDREGGTEGLMFSLKNAAANATYYQKYPKEQGEQEEEERGAYDPHAPDNVTGFELPGEQATLGRRVLEQAESSSPYISRSHDHLSLLQLMVLWRQLVVTGNAFACLCLNEKKNELAMQFLSRTQAWANRDDILPAQKRAELKGYVCDAMAFYYFRCRKASAALSEARKACKLLDKSGNFDSVAIAKLHVAAVMCQQGQFRESHAMVFEVIAMVEEGRLAFDEANPKQLCIVAVAYHNLAVVQLKLEMSDLACKNSMNARKIARLCLSFSNRWVHVFQYTHECALEDAKYRLEVQRKEGRLDERQLRVMKELTDAMFEHANM